MTSSSEKRYTVLLVDDNTDLLRALTVTLEVMGNFTVIGATDGVQGLERFFEARPDCVVIDIKMPGLDGYQLVKALRGDPESGATPLIVLTALAQDEDRFAGLAVGADAYLVKPVKPQDLAAAIHQAVATNAAERARRLRELVESPRPEE